MAQTMSLIEPTDSRAMRAMDASGPSSCAPCLADLAEQRDPREVGADVVVQVGGDARAHVGHLEQACDAIPVQRIDHRGPVANATSVRNHQRCQTGLEDGEGDVAGSALAIPSEFTARTRNL